MTDLLAKENLVLSFAFFNTTKLNWLAIYSISLSFQFHKIYYKHYHLMEAMETCKNPKSM